jgi:hypothetical protein
MTYLLRPERQEEEATRAPTKQRTRQRVTIGAKHRREEEHVHRPVS